MAYRARTIELGLGLIGIGREWGAEDRTIASEAQANELLRQALALNIGFFDTAPSYGASEARLGRFLSELSSEVRAGLRVATKFGELWRDGSSVIDHSYDSLCRSVDRSLRLLGQIDLLQIHKCTSTVLKLPSVMRAVEYARGLGVRSVGSSVSDREACQAAAHAEFIEAIQLPLNLRRPELADLARTARERGKLVIANRPVESGHMLAGVHGERRASILRDSFSFLAREGAADVVLTGTRSSSRLCENYAAFTLATADAISAVHDGSPFIKPVGA
jgi:aryl-alcohol dehydrogenase-like predicted oxidoreductase